MKLLMRAAVGALVIGAGFTTTPAFAQDAGVDVGADILQLLVDEGLVSREKAQVLLDKAQEAARRRQATVAAAAPAPNTVDVGYVPEIVKEQLRQEIRAEVVKQAKEERWMAPNSAPAWLDKITIDGDFRLRYQGEYFGDDNFPFFPDVQAINNAGGVSDAAGFPLLNSTVNRHRLRYQARLGVKAQITPKVKVGIRLASGNDSGAISTNETLGDYFDKDAIWIDRAFIQISPLPGLDLVGGRMENPFYSTDLVWDADINPEGVAAVGRHTFDVAWKPEIFATAGAFPLQERARDDDDRWLYAGQIGADFAPSEQTRFSLAVAYYDYTNVQSRKNPAGGSRIYDYTAPPVISNGNSVFNIRTDGTTTLAGLASDYDLLNVTGSLTLRQFDPVEVKITADYVRNLAFDKDEIYLLRGSSTGVAPGDTGWQLKVDVGAATVRKLNDWQISLAYKYLETDAVLDIFTDSDFGLGGTDNEGFVLKATYGIYDNTSVGLTWLSTRSIARPPFDVDVLQLNLNSRF